MARPKGAEKGDPPKQARPATLKQLADHLGLAPATISLVMNGAPVADTIAADTKKRIREAAERLGYRPNFLARCLRSRRSFTIGVLTPEVSHGYNTTVLGGIEDHLLRAGYFYFVASHRFQPDLIEEYPELFLYRSVDGLIVLNAPWNKELPVPVVTISCHHEVKNTTRIVLDHHRAAELALGHLWKLGHRKIAVIKGQSFTPDSEIRWDSISQVAVKASRPIDEDLVVQIEDNLATPELGYRVTQTLLGSGKRFTALFAFNDIAAVGAIRAIHEHGLRVPEDVSVVGFDDIDSAAYQHPGLTTIRQPLRQMGKMAAQTVLKRIAGKDSHSMREVVFEPELIVRGTTGTAKDSRQQHSSSVIAAR
ncbi:MAG TPA: LacI family DNA-binding transcriptional regulator [Terriglobales bacterium]|jgi:LacI family transcriptional regulator|nr:LacI family DNA-binding transcriptional regulator [Terriglobales bacterium]